MDLKEARIDEFFEQEKVSGVQIANYLKALGLYEETMRFRKEKQNSSASKDASGRAQG